MVNIFKSSSFNKLLLSCVLVTFSVAILAPPPCYAQAGTNDAIFMLRINALIEKTWKYKERANGFLEKIWKDIDRTNVDKLFEAALEIKQEFENYSGQPFDLDEELDKALSAIKQQGGTILKKDEETLRNFIKNKDNKMQTRVACMASYLQDSPSMDFKEYEALYNAAHGQDTNNVELDIQKLPMNLIIGIVMIVAGGILVGGGIILKIPVCVTYGEQLATSGISVAISGGAAVKDKTW